MADTKESHQQFSLNLPSIDQKILHGHLTLRTGYLMVFLTTSQPDGSSPSRSAMGSFVYAMPDLRNDKQTISTPLCTSGSSIEYAIRLSKLLARKVNLPVYIGCSMNFAGITTDEEMEGLTSVVKHIMEIYKDQKST